MSSENHPVLIPFMLLAICKGFYILRCVIFFICIFFLMRKIIMLENIRSAYNCWNIIRTADALGWEVWLIGYTPHPDEQIKVKKTSLGAENHVQLQRFDYTKEAIAQAKKEGCTVVAWEITDQAIPVTHFSCSQSPEKGIALLVGNEIDGVLDSTLKSVDAVLYIPMQGIKESLNVGQSSAILMRELWKNEK